MMLVESIEQRAPSIGDTKQGAFKSKFRNYRCWELKFGDASEKFQGDFVMD